MAEPGELTFGEVARGTVEAVSTNILPTAIYAVVMAVVGSALDLTYAGALNGRVAGSGALALLESSYGLAAAVVGLLLFLVANIGQYFLWEAMMRNAGLARGLGRHRYVAFVAQSILILLATTFGLLFLIVPGLVMFARWSIAPALVVRSDLGMVEAMRRSWNTLKGNSTPVILVSLAIGGIVLLLSLVLGGMGAASDLVTVVSGQLLAQTQGALGVAMGMFLYRRLYDESGELVEVFA